MLPGSGINYKIIGITKSSKTIKLALKAKAINIGSTKLNSKALKDVDLIFICTPLHLIPIYLNKISKLKLKGNVIVTDVGSTKSEICKSAKKLCFIGGHPMAGTENAGFIASRTNLFKNNAWVLTPIDKNPKTKNALKEIQTIIKKIGAKPVITTPEKHDGAVALISHLPLLVSVGLCEVLKSTKDLELKNLAMSIASSGFRDTTRIASGNPQMNSNLLISNLEKLKLFMPGYFNKLNENLKLAKSKPKILVRKLKDISLWRRKLIRNRISY